MQKLSARFFVAITLLTLYSFTFWGSTSVDSLKNILDEKKGEDKYLIYEQLATYYINSNLDSNFYFLSQLKELAIKKNNVTYEAIALSSIGLNHFFKGEYFEAEDCVKKAIELQKQIGDTVNLADSYNYLAGIYGESGQYSKSTIILFEAINIYEAQNDLPGVIKSYNNLGYLFMKLDNYKKAKKYYQKALFIIDTHNINYNRGFLYSNLGICYKEFGDNKNALTNYRLALGQYKANSTLNAIPMLYQSFGNLYAFRLNEPDSAFFYFNEGISLAEKYDTNSLIELYLSLGQLYSNQNNSEKSIDAFNKSLDVAINNEDLNGQMQAHLNLSKANKKLEYFHEALNHYEEYSSLKDSIDSKETQLSISRLNEKYENDKNKFLVEKLKIEQKHNRILLVALIVGIALLLIAMAFILYGLAQRKRRTRAEKSLLEKELRFKNKELASHALMMMQKNNLLQGLHNSIKNAEKESSEKLQGIRNQLRNQIRHHLKADKDWELFKLYFEQINKSFFKKLETINPDLTQNDIRLAALIKLRFNIKEAASVLNLSPNSIKGTRSRLRKKLRLESSDDLSRFIERIE